MDMSLHRRIILIPTKIGETQETVLSSWFSETDLNGVPLDELANLVIDKVNLPTQTGVLP